MRRLLTLALLAGACAAAFAVAAGSPGAPWNGLAPILRLPEATPKRELPRPKVPREAPPRRPVSDGAPGTAPPPPVAPVDSTPALAATPKRDVAVTVTVLPGVTAFALETAAPNPVRDQTLIRFRCPASALVRVEIFTIVGRRVAVPVYGVFPAGIHNVPWNAAGEDGRRLAPGLYVMRMAVGQTFSASRKITIVG